MPSEKSRYIFRKANQFRGRIGRDEVRLYVETLTKDEMQRIISDGVEWDDIFERVLLIKTVLTEKYLREDMDAVKQTISFGLDPDFIFECKNKWGVHRIVEQIQASLEILILTGHVGAVFSIMGFALTKAEEALDSAHDCAYLDMAVESFRHFHGRVTSV